MIKILQYGNPILEQLSTEVTDVKDKEVLKLIDEMVKLLDREQEHSAGLSAPQVGKLLRIAICRRTDLEEKREGKSRKKLKAEWEVMINPKIVEKSKEDHEAWEGCLSINYGDLFGKVSRPKEIKVEYLDRDGNKKEIAAVDFFSHVFNMRLII